MNENTMTMERKGLVSAGAALLWRRRSILWWVFGVNFVLGWLGTMPALHALKGALGHTLAGEQMLKGFDFGMFRELTRVPDVDVMRFTGTSHLFAGLFALFMLFASGGILEAYRHDRKLTTQEFFSACGAYFWPFVRLMLLSAIPFVFLGSLYLALGRLADRAGDKAASDHVAFLADTAGTFLLFLVVLFVRLWFDVAKSRAVAQNERRMWRNMWKALGITSRQMGTLLWMYFRISLVAWMTLLIGFLIWTKLPPTAVPAIFILLELVLLVQLAARLWQTASAMEWYKHHAEMVPADAVDYTTTHPVEVIEATPQMTLYPETETEPPPADA
ncbi:MAG: hypothetical protein P4M04_06045 [Acidobacteriota bacterium]|nr:hypothetical protein [Acidobacteriota bacterium]